MDAKVRGSKVAFLCPEDEKIYETFGFQSMKNRNRIEVLGNKNKWYGVASFSRLEPETKERAAEFANAQLYASDLDLYVKRSVEYYEILHKERKALNGKVIVLRDGNVICGVAAYTREADMYEITEVICDSEDGQKVLESICGYLAEAGFRKVIFSDAYFLGQVAGAGIVVKQEEKPYIMLKALDQTEVTDNLNVYINGIT